jgi:hypothetical protein
VTGAEEENGRVAGGGEPVAGVVLQRGLLDQQRAGPVVADEEDGAAALPGVVAGDDRAFDLEVVSVAVVVDGPAAAAAGVPGRAGFAPTPIAWLPVMRLSGKITPRAGR